MHVNYKEIFRRVTLTGAGLLATGYLYFSSGENQSYGATIPPTPTREFIGPERPTPNLTPTATRKPPIVTRPAPNEEQNQIFVPGLLNKDDGINSASLVEPTIGIPRPEPTAQGTPTPSFEISSTIYAPTVLMGRRDHIFKQK